jgi:type IV secretory pathway TrbD component
MTNTLTDILTPNHRLALDNVRAAAERIWKIPLHRTYTDHTVAHSERVIALLDGLTAGMMGTGQRLVPGEVFVLLAAAYLHDVGMQDERFANGDLEAIREAHHEVTAEWIYRTLEAPETVVGLGLPDDPAWWMRWRWWSRPTAGSTSPPRTTILSLTGERTCARASWRRSSASATSWTSTTAASTWSC